MDSVASVRDPHSLEHSPRAAHLCYRASTSHSSSSRPSETRPVVSMIFTRRLCAAAAVVASVLAACCLEATHAWVPHIVAKGNKFFDSDSGLEFRMKGVAYYPRPNDGKLYEVDNYDWAADEHEEVWKSHLDVMEELGANTIRLYSVDPSKSHDKFMCECSKRGIYVLVGMTAP